MFGYLQEVLPAEAPREIELKFAVADNQANALVAALGPWPVRKKMHQITTYFDTPDAALALLGLSLRVRRIGDRFVQTLKADRKAGVASNRAEWEWPVEANKPDLTLLAHMAHWRLPLNLDLQPVVVTIIDRTVRIIQREDGTEIEVAFDEGVISTEGAQQPVRELELELRQGNLSSLFQWAVDLHAAVPLMIETKTKSQRGHRLRSSISALSGDAPLNSLAQQADDIVLRPDMSAVEAFRWIVITSLGHLLTNQAVGLAGEGQGMCQIGAAIWRLRATLTLFKPYLEPNATFRFQSELRVVSRLFRGARNRDVFFADATPGDAVLRPSAKTAHKAAHHDLIRTLRAPSFTALVLGLTAWVEGSALMDPLCRQPLSQLASPLLSRLARRLYRHPIEHQSDLEWHALSRLLEDLRCGIKLSSIYSEHVANT